jgi:cyanate permease
MIGIAFVWSIMLAAASGDNDVAMTVLSLFGILHLYRWWKQKQQDRQHDIPDPKRTRLSQLKFRNQFVLLAHNAVNERPEHGAR